MNAKTAKKIRQVHKRDRKQYAESFTKEFAALGLRERLRFCWKILRMPRSKP